ncbi:MAG: hypothetical protein H6Q89_553 [Myxococcaceae bacterium]|nr:hypothetical protein [Myxococcaceae bacterium]
MELENSKIRRIILAEHDVLRGALRTIEAGLGKVAEGDVPAQITARSQLKQLLATFLKHIEHEERILRPVLKDIDAWGPERIAAMDSEHKEQRARVEYLSGPLGEAAPTKWVEEVRQFIGHLREDMATEEQDCLDPRLLRDDVIVIDGFTG